MQNLQSAVRMSLLLSAAVLALPAAWLGALLWLAVLVAELYARQQLGVGYALVNALVSVLFFSARAVYAAKAAEVRHV